MGALSIVASRRAGAERRILLINPSPDPGTLGRPEQLPTVLRYDTRA